MRSVVLLLVAVLAGCPSRAAEVSALPGEPEPAGDSARGCQSDDDCVAAAATCCDCPAFAIEVDAPANRACTGVVCPLPSTCPGNVRAECDQGACVLACVAMACPAACANGYQIDATGCLSCECATGPMGGCTVDGDCVQTRADCCGCELGGEDTAVLVSQLASFDAGLGCAASPACPTVNVCDPGAAPRCVQGSCELLAAGALPPQACGRPDLPACPPGTMCLVNADPTANELGVGVCAAP